MIVFGWSCVLIKILLILILILILIQLKFYPCKKFRDLDKRYKNSFGYCRANIHLLPYEPEGYASPCSTAALKIKKIIDDNGIDRILYKGGCIEEQICKELGISSFNIEKLGKLRVG